MDASRRVTRTLTCRDGHRFRLDVWEVVDLDNHPELRDDCAALLVAPCSECGLPTPLDTPLLLFAVLPDVPIVAIDGWASDDPAGRATVARARDAPVPPPGFVVSTTRAALELLLAASDSEQLLVRLDHATGSTRTIRDLRLAIEALRTAGTAMFFFALDAQMPLAELDAEVRRRGVRGNAAVRGYLDVNADVLLGTTEPAIAAQRLSFVERLVAGTDPARAQQLLQEDIVAVVRDDLQPELTARLTELYDGKGRRDPGREDCFTRAVALAEMLGEDQTEARLRVNRAFERADGTNFWDAAACTSAEHDLRRAIQLTADRDPVLNATASANLAGIVGTKSTGERGANLEEAIGLLQHALQTSTEQADPDTWAMNATNLSILYVDRERGERAENLRTAEDLCRSALRRRPPDGNPVDRAFTLANLARVLLERAESGPDHGRDDVNEAVRLSEQAATDFTAAALPDAAANALHNAAEAVQRQVGRSLQDRTTQRAASVSTTTEVRAVLRRTGQIYPTVTEQVSRIAHLARSNPAAVGFSNVPDWVLAVTDRTLDAHDRELVDQALRLSARARAVREPAGGIALAMSYKQWDDLLQLTGAPDEERVGVLERALSLVEVGDLPDQVIEVAWRLGAIHSERKDWADAARALTTATRALDWIHRELFSEASRIGELSTRYKLVEVAAYAVARSGRPAEAVVILENGRTRGLAAEVLDDSAAMATARATMPAVAAEIDRLRRALRQLGRDPGSAAASGAPTPTGAQLRAELEGLARRVREVEGFADFLSEVPAAEIAAASRPDCPLAYVVATPAGCVALLVEPADAAADVPGLRASALFSDVTSSELVTCLHRFDDNGSRGILVSDGPELDSDIHHGQRLLGRAFGQNLVDVVRATGASAVRIVPGGILAALPVSTALVADPEAVAGVLRPLSAALTVAVAPSARVHGVCRARAELRANDPVRLVCVADPQAGDPLRALRWSRWEARAILRLYGSERSLMAEGTAATRAFMVEYAGTASHLHLALHARSDPGEAMRSGIGLADGVMTAAEFDSSTALVARVVVVSSCESGRISIGQAPNEFRGLPFALIGRGAASVVAALWPVDDRATSLLMVRFHEELVRLESAGPFSTDLVARALQTAQEWLRTSSAGDLALAAARHSTWADDGDRARADRDARDLSVRPEPSDFPAGPYPFGAPRHWAGFITIA